MKRYALTLAVAVAAAGAVVYVASSASGEAGQMGGNPPEGLTQGGRVLWNFEALLRRAFGQRRVWVSRGENFSCAGLCAPASTYSPYRFTFASPTNSVFHLSSRKFKDGDFGNFPAPILVRGRSVACNPIESRFLIRYRNAASFALACLTPTAG